MANSLHFGNLPFGITEKEIEDRLRVYGATSVKLVSRPDKVFAFADIPDKRMAEACISDLNRQRWWQRSIFVSFSDRQKQSSFAGRQESSTDEAQFKLILQELQKTGVFDDWKKKVVSSFEKSRHWTPNYESYKDLALHSEVYSKAKESQSTAFVPLSNSLFRYLSDVESGVIEDDVEDVIHDYGHMDNLKDSVNSIIDRILGLRKGEEEKKEEEKKEEEKPDYSSFKQYLVSQILEKDLFSNVQGIKSLFESTVNSYIHLDRGEMEKVLRDLKEELELDWDGQLYPSAKRKREDFPIVPSKRPHHDHI